MIQENEYDFDSSDEEDIQNTIGNIPMEWYRNTPHNGYDINGRPLMKMSNMKDAVDIFINNVENSDKTTIIKDSLTGQNVVLSEKDIMLIKRLCSSRGFLSSHTNDDEYVTDWFTQHIMETPVSAHPPQKKSFIPSIPDRKIVSRMVYAIKMGRMKLPEPEDKDEVLDSDYDHIVNPKISYIYRVDSDLERGNYEWLPNNLHPDYKTKYQNIRQIIRPPPENLPNHNESYNPPEEYLLNEKERKILISKFYDPSYNPCRHIDERPQIPTIYSNLRSVPFSPALIIEKQKRLRDLNYAPRIVKDKVQSSTEKMLQQDKIDYNKMKPYPNVLQSDCSSILGDAILSLSVSSCGQYIAAIGYENLTIFGNEIYTPCQILDPIRSFPISLFNQESEELTIRNPSLSWHPQCLLLAVAVNREVRIINPSLDSFVELEHKLTEWWTDSVNTKFQDDDDPASKKTKLSNNWSFKKPEQTKRKQRQMSSLVIELDETVLDMSWHSCGDYLLTICGKGKATNSGGKVHIHRLSKCASIAPLADNKRIWLSARFHCQKNMPLLFLAESNSSNIQVYDLSQKKLVKTLQVNGQPSVMEMHPKENHLVVGTFEGKICWFDLDMGISPFKTLGINQNSLRSIAFHHEYPLMACATANGSVVVFYSQVFSTFDEKPIVVPVMMFEKVDKAGDMYSLCFHTTQVRLYCGGADKTLRAINSSH